MKPRCLETRLLPNGLKWRRYRRPDGTLFKTIECPVEVWRALNNQSWGKDRMSQWLRARTRDERRVRALMLRNAGWKSIAIASELQVPVRTVQRWVQHGAA